MGEGDANEIGRSRHRHRCVWPQVAVVPNGHRRLFPQARPGPEILTPDDRLQHVAHSASGPDGVARQQRPAIGQEHVAWISAPSLDVDEIRAVGTVVADS